LNEPSSSSYRFVGKALVILGGSSVDERTFEITFSVLEIQSNEKVILDVK